MFDCVKKGYVLDGFPQTREQALALQSNGVHPSHCGRLYNSFFDFKHSWRLMQIDGENTLFSMF